MDSSDPKPKSTEEPNESYIAKADAICSLSAPTTLAIELEPNSHTTDTKTEPQTEPQTKPQTEAESDAKERNKHVCFNAIEVLEPYQPTTSRTYDRVREYVRQIDTLSEMQQCFGEFRTTAKKRQLNQMSTAEGDEEETTTKEMALKRMRGDSNDSLNITINEMIEAEAVATDIAVPQPQPQPQPKPEVCVALKHVEEDNQEIAERFKLIMEMFDNFTKNLESLEVPGALKESPKQLRRKRTNSWDVQDISPRVHRSRYDNYMQELTGRTEPSEVDTIIETATDPQIQHHTWQLDFIRDRPIMPFVQSAQPLEQRIEMKFLRPAQKDMATAMSGIDLRLSNIKDCATVGCQTVAIADHSSTTSMPSSRTEIRHFTSLDALRLDTLQNYSPMDCRVETYIVDTNAIGNANNVTNMTKAVITSEDAGGGNVAAVISPAATAATTEAADTMIKMPASNLLLERSTYVAAVTAGPVVEHTFHTIHIEATSSPSSSVMQRAPLCTRLWNVITDFCTAICLCLQVNRDSLFCLGFCIAFVVSASFLTAFFYRTLSVTPDMFQQHHMQMQSSSAPSGAGLDHNSAASGRDNIYYL